MRCLRARMTSKSFTRISLSTTGAKALVPLLAVTRRLRIVPRSRKQPLLMDKISCSSAMP